LTLLVLSRICRRFVFPHTGRPLYRIFIFLAPRLHSVTDPRVTFLHLFAFSMFPANDPLREYLVAFFFVPMPIFLLRAPLRDRAPSSGISPWRSPPRECIGLLNPSPVRSVWIRTSFAPSCLPLSFRRRQPLSHRSNLCASLPPPCSNSFLHD